MLHTVEEAAQRLRLSPHTIRAAVRIGTIPSVRLGRRVRIADETLLALERCGHPLLTRRTADAGLET